jgi:hypothetical protein
VPWLHRPRALAPLRLAEIALTGIRPPAVIAIKDFAEFVEHFRSDPDTPTDKSFACGSGRAFFLPSSTHRGDFEQVRTFILRFRHGLECHRGLLKTRCLFAAKHPHFITSFRGILDRLVLLVRGVESGNASDWAFEKLIFT